jgi:hypothetical protein
METNSPHPPVRGLLSAVLGYVLLAEFAGRVLAEHGGARPTLLVKDASLRSHNLYRSSQLVPRTQLENTLDPRSKIYNEHAIFLPGSHPSDHVELVGSARVTAALALHTRYKRQDANVVTRMKLYSGPHLRLHPEQRNS